MAEYNFKWTFLGFHCDDYPGDSVKEKILHRRTHCEDATLKRFKCGICPYSTNSTYNLNRHSLVHSGERPHTCDMCSQVFSLQHMLKRHWVMHTGEKPYSCDV